MKLNLHEEKAGLIVGDPVHHAAATSVFTSTLTVRGRRVLTLYEAAGGALGFEGLRQWAGDLGLRAGPGQPAIPCSSHLVLLPSNVESLRLEAVEIFWAPQVVDGRPLAVEINRLRGGCELSDDSIYRGQFPGRPPLPCWAWIRPTRSSRTAA